MLTCFKIILTEKNRRKFAVAYTAGKWVTIDTFCWRISHLGKIGLDAHPQRTPKGTVVEIQQELSSWRESLKRRRTYNGTRKEKKLEGDVTYNGDEEISNRGVNEETD
jgi:hypothetical protein